MLKKRKIGKTAAVSLLFVALICLLASHAPRKPESVVADFCKSMQEYDIEAMSSCVADNIYDIQLKKSGRDVMSDALYDYYKENAGKIKYSIESSEFEEKIGSVTVRFSYVDSRSYFDTAMRDYYRQNIAYDMDGISLSSKEKEGIFADSVKANRESNQNRSEETVTFSCIKICDEWLIQEVPREISNIYYSNAYAVDRAEI